MSVNEIYSAYIEQLFEYFGFHVCVLILTTLEDVRLPKAICKLAGANFNLSDLPFPVHYPIATAFLL